MIKRTQFVCDSCGNLVPAGEVETRYGPLCVQVELPDLFLTIEQAHFCNIDCAMKWMTDILPGKLP